MNALRAIVSLAIMACLVGPRLTTLHAEEPGLSGVLTVTGTVVLEDGKPAAGALVEYRGTDFEPRVEVKADKQGAINSAHFQPLRPTLCPLGRWFAASNAFNHGRDRAPPILRGRSISSWRQPSRA